MRAKTQASRCGFFQSGEFGNIKKKKKVAQSTLCE
jgi:hypothetical protein